MALSSAHMKGKVVIVQALSSFTLLLTELYKLLVTERTAEKNQNQ
jgi:hypothetical protein